MNRRALGRTGLVVSEVGLGCWQLGGTDWGDLDDERAGAILGAAVDAGINLFDTADVYGDGRSETLIGRFMRGMAERPVVATKLGRGGGMYPSGYTEAAVRAAVEGSLERLGQEALDLVQLHCVPTGVLRRGEVFGWLRRLREEGKIRHWGASVESVEEGLICLEEEDVASLQIILNVLRQRPVEALFPRVRECGTGILARLPLASGVLSGRMTLGTEFPAHDHRSYNKDGAAFNVGETFAGLPFEKAVELVDELRVLVPEGVSMAAHAQRWVLDHPEVSTVITGASRPEQVRENARVSGMVRLESKLHERLAAFYRERVEGLIRGPN